MSDRTQWGLSEHDLAMAHGFGELPSGPRASFAELKLAWGNLTTMPLMPRGHQDSLRRGLWELVYLRRLVTKLLQELVDRYDIDDSGMPNEAMALLEQLRDTEELGFIRTHYPDIKLP